MYAGTTARKSLHSGAAGGRDDRAGRRYYAQDISELVALSDHAAFSEPGLRA